MTTNSELIQISFIVVVAFQIAASDAAEIRSCIQDVGDKEERVRRLRALNA